MMKYWREAGGLSAVIAFTVWMTTMHLNVQAGEKSDARQDIILAAAINLSKKLDVKLDMLKEFGKISQEVWEDVRMMPKLPQDADGNDYPEWYLVGDSAIYIISNTGDCEVRKIPFTKGE